MLTSEALARVAGCHVGWRRSHRYPQEAMARRICMRWGDKAIGVQISPGDGVEASSSPEIEEGLEAGSTMELADFVARLAGSGNHACSRLIGRTPRKSDRPDVRRFGE